MSASNEPSDQDTSYKYQSWVLNTFVPTGRIAVVFVITMALTAIVAVAFAYRAALSGDIDLTAVSAGLAIYAMVSGVLVIELRFLVRWAMD